MSQNSIHHETLHTPNPELDRLSAENITNIINSYSSEAVRVGQFDSEADAVAAVEAGRDELERSHSLKINMSAESLGRFVQTGKRETYWDAQQQTAISPVIGLAALQNGKAMHAAYAEYRAAAEAGLAALAPAGSDNVRPIYVAVAGSSQRDTTRGPSESYGNWWVELTPDLEDKAVYNFSDSHAGISESKTGEYVFDTSTVLNKADALTAKAIMDLSGEYNEKEFATSSRSGSFAVNADSSKMMVIAGRRGGGYVEAAVFSDITSEASTSFGASIGTVQQLAAAGQLIKTHPEIISRINSLELSDNVVPDLVRTWLGMQLPVGSLLANAGSDKSPADPVAERLGIDMSSDYITVARAVHRVSAQLSRDPMHGDLPYKFPDISSSDKAIQWDTYLKILNGMAERTVDPDQAQRLHDFISLQQTRVFFDPRTIRLAAQ